jgi:hypothetical protein
MTDNPAPSTLRWRRWRDRQKAARGENFIQFLVDHALIELLLVSGKINERDSETAEKLAQAIRRCCIESCTNALDTACDR